MKFSIITVSYNSIDTIADTVHSVSGQSHPYIEHLIIDGASTDGTLKILDSLKNEIDILISEADKGIYHAMNKGIDKASGEIIGILNSDDIYTDEFVLRDISRLFEDPKIEGVYADLVYVERNNTNKIKRKWISGTLGDFIKGWMPPHPTFFVRRSVYDKYGTFNLDFTSAADYELMLRFIHKHQIKIAYLPRTIIKMRMGGQSNVTLKNRLKANKEDRNAWQVNGLKPGKFTFIRKPLSKLGQFFKK